MSQRINDEIKRHMGYYVPHVLNKVIPQLNKYNDEYENAIIAGDEDKARQIQTSFEEYLDKNVKNDGSIVNIKNLFNQAKESDLTPEIKKVKEVFAKPHTLGDIFTTLAKNGFSGTDQYNQIKPHLVSQLDKKNALKAQIEADSKLDPLKKTMARYTRGVEKSVKKVEKLKKDLYEAIQKEDQPAIDRIQKEYADYQKQQHKDIALLKPSISSKIIQNIHNSQPEPLENLINTEGYDTYKILKENEKLEKAANALQYYDGGQYTFKDSDLEQANAPLLKAFDTWVKNEELARKDLTSRKSRELLTLRDKIESGNVLTPEEQAKLAEAIALPEHQMPDPTAVDIKGRLKSLQAIKDLEDKKQNTILQQQYLEDQNANKEEEKLSKPSENETSEQKRKRLIKEGMANSAKFTNPEFLEEYPQKDEFSGGPKWQSQAAHAIAKRAFAESQTKYTPYKGQRTANLTPLQTLAQEKIIHTLEDKGLKDLYNNSKTKIENLSDKKSVDNIHEYMNPFNDNVIDALEKKMKRRFNEETVPVINANFIAKGSQRGFGRRNAIDKARERMDEDFLHQAANLKYQNYNNSMINSAADLERQASAAQQMQNLKQSEESSQIENANLLDTIGTREQQLAQTKLNMDYEDFLKQRNYPMEQTSTLNEIIRGIPVNHSKSSFTPYQAQASPYTQLAGGLQSVFAANKMSGKKRGGTVKKLATGGQVDYSKMSEDDYRNRLNMALQQVEGNKVNPMWGMLANMGAHIAGNSTQNNVMSAIGESVKSGLEGHRAVMDQNTVKQQQAENLMKLIVESRRYEEEKAEERRLKQEDMAIKRAHLDLLKQKPSINGINGNNGNSSIPTKVSNDVMKEQLKSIAEMAQNARTSLPIAKNAARIAGKDLGLTEISGQELPEWMSTGYDLLTLNPERRTDRNVFKSLVGKQLVDISENRGNVSGTELDRYREALPSLQHTPEGRKKIADFEVALQTNHIKRHEFISDLTENHNVPLREAEKLWQTFIDNYKITDDNLNVIKENLELNPIQALFGNNSQQTPQYAPQHKTLKETQPYYAPQTELENLSPQQQMELMMQSKNFKNIKHKKGGFVKQPIIMTKKESLKQALEDKYA